MSLSFSKISKLLDLLNKEERLTLLQEVLASLNEECETDQKNFYQTVEQWFIKYIADSRSLC